MLEPRWQVQNKPYVTYSPTIVQQSGKEMCLERCKGNSHSVGVGVGVD